MPKEEFGGKERALKMSPTETKKTEVKTPSKFKEFINLSAIKLRDFLVNYKDVILLGGISGVAIGGLIYSVCKISQLSRALEIANRRIYNNKRELRNIKKSDLPRLRELYKEYFRSNPRLKRTDSEDFYLKGIYEDLAGTNHLVDKNTKKINKLKKLVKDLVTENHLLRGEMIKWVEDIETKNQIQEGRIKELETFKELRQNVDLFDINEEINKLQIKQEASEKKNKKQDKEIRTLKNLRDVDILISQRVKRV